MMKLSLKTISFLGLILTLIPSFFVFNGYIELSTGKYLMLLGTILWFTTCPFWIGKNKKEA